MFSKKIKLKRVAAAILAATLVITSIYVFDKNADITPFPVAADKSDAVSNTENGRLISNKSENSAVSGDKNTGITKGFIQKLIDKGFIKEHITEAVMMGERIKYQLEQIVSEDKITITSIEIEDKDKRSKDEKIKYEALNKSFNICDCVELMLKLENEFNGFSGVLNEYLLSLQIEIDLKKYLIDKKEYEKEKNEKIVLISNIITAEMIETKLLEKLRMSNKDVNTELDKKPGGNNGNKTSEKQTNEINNSDLPKAESVSPPNPSVEINKEIENIKQKSFGYSK